MKILVDICHPAHVHFFKHAIRNWQQQHEVLVTARDKDCVIALLDAEGINYQLLTAKKRCSIFGMIFELIQRNWQLAKFAYGKKIDCFTAVGGTFAAHVAKLFGKPSVIFYDSDNATLQNAITYPFASCVIVPECYAGKLPASRNIRYAGLHELAYLHPNYFQADREIAIANGLNPEKKNILVRLVANTANHDIGAKGVNEQILRKIIAKAKQINAQVIICAEAGLAPEFSSYSYQGDAAAMHHVMAFCSAYIGDSPTMAQEAAVLGAPGLYLSSIRCSTIVHLQDKYKLVRAVFDGNLEMVDLELETILSLPADEIVARHQRLLHETIDVSQFIATAVSNFPQVLADFNNDPQSFASPN